MATFLDITALEGFSKIFVFLFIWLGIYATLAYTKPFGSNQFVNILLGFLVGLFTLMSDLVTTIVLDIIPWLVIAFLFAMFVTAAAKSFGGSMDAGALAGMKPLFILFVVIAVIIASAVEIRQAISVPGDNETSSDFDRDFSQTTTIIFHPNFLGAVFLLALAVFTIALLATRHG